MDIPPEKLNPDIIEIAKLNPMIKEIVTIYLHEIPMREGRALTWMETLEMIVLKLHEQYDGMTEAATHKTKKETQLSLVNEKERPCPECHTITWFIQDGERKCAVCDGRKGRRNVVYQNQLLKKSLAEVAAMHTRKGADRLQRTLEMILAIEPNVPNP